MNKIPANHVVELKEFALSHFKGLGARISNVSEYYEQCVVADGTEYDVNIYSDREYGSGETDGYNATAYALSLEDGYFTLNPLVFARLFEKWMPQL